MMPLLRPPLPLRRVGGATKGNGQRRGFSWQGVQGLALTSWPDARAAPWHLHPCSVPLSELNANISSLFGTFCSGFAPGAIFRPSNGLRRRSKGPLFRLLGRFQPPRLNPSPSGTLPGAKFALFLPFSQAKKIFREKSLSIVAICPIMGRQGEPCEYKNTPEDL